MSIRLRLLTLSMLALVLAFGSDAFAQYTCRVGNYVVTNPGSGVSSISSSGTAVTLTSQDDGYATTTLPFAFNYDSTAYSAGTGMIINSNGMYAFGTSNTSFYSGCCSNNLGSATYSGACMPWTVDDYVNGACYYQTQGSSPNRTFTVEWHTMRFYSGNTSTFDMQVILYETSNVIDFCYSPNNTSMGSSAAGVGLNGTTNYSGFVSQAAYKSTSSTPTNNIRWTPPPPPAPPAQLSANPKTLNFGPVVGGNTATMQFTIRSLGPNTLIFSAPISISGAPDFSVTGPLPLIKTKDSLLAGQSMIVTVSFTPVTGGTRNATLTVGTNGRDSGTQNISLTGIGVAPAISMSTTDLFKKVRLKLGDSITKSFPVTSSGTGPLTFNSFTFSGLNPNEYRVVRGPQNPLPVGVTDSIWVTYAPTFEGRPDAVLTVNSNALNFPNLNVTMFGTGILQRLVITPTPLNFGSVATGVHDTMMLNLFNPGSDTLRVLRDYLSTADADYTLLPLAPKDTAIPPGQSRNVSVIFTPVRTGIRTARLRVTTNIPLTFESPRKDTSAFVVDITGNGAPMGVLGFTGQTIDSAIVGQQVCTSDTIWNIGTADITVTSLDLRTGDSADFSYSGLTLPVTLKPGEYRVVTVCFKPSAHGVRHTVALSAATTSGVNISLSTPIVGYGLTVCASSVPVNTTPLFAADKPIVKSTVNGSATTTIVITNCGDIPTVYNLALDAAAPADYSISGQATSAMIQPGGSATFTIMFTPSKRGAIGTTATITGGPAPLAFTLAGVGYEAEITGTGTAKVANGQSKNFDVTVTNAGNIDWSPGVNPTITSTYAADYSFVTGTTATANGGTGTLTFKFTPSIEGVEAATVTFPSQTPDMKIASISLNAEGTPQVGVAMRSEQKGFRLEQNFPNPATTGTQINFVTPQSAMVTIEVMDVTGHVVATVANERFDAGNHSVTLDASKLASGTYFCTMTSGDIRLARQMVVSK